MEELMATDYEQMCARDKALREEMATLCKNIAKAMPEWTLEVKDDYDAETTLSHPDGLKFHLRRDHSGKRDRITVQTWSWPRYKSKWERGEWQTAVLSPRDLYPRDADSPSISVAIARGASAVVKDINTRFLPEYKRLYGLCKAKAQELETYALKSRADWMEICRVANADPERDHIYGDGRFDVENRKGKAYFTAYLTASQLTRVLEIVKAESAD
jgi:hypothetical protein